MSSSDSISPKDFYTSDSEKIKFNWFCYEYAHEILATISSDLNSSLRQSGVTEENIREFCIHYSKNMKPMILAVLSKKIDKTVHSYEPIEEFFPNIGDEMVDKLLLTVGKAWGNLLGTCELCPVRCISEKDEKTNMFDEPLGCDMEDHR